jgi:hypothetical protein
MIKSSDETRNWRNVPQSNKDDIWQTYCQHHTKCRKTKTISSKVRNEKRVSTLSTLTQYIFQFLARAIRQDEEIKGIQIQKEIKIIPICRSYDLIYKGP